MLALHLNEEKKNKFCMKFQCYRNVGTSTVYINEALQIEQENTIELMPFIMFRVLTILIKPTIYSTPHYSIYLQKTILQTS